jgi:hypothetical protein
MISCVDGDICIMRFSEMLGGSDGSIYTAWVLYSTASSYKHNP